MATVEAAPAAGFIRPDGKEKVTGTGRYTADLAFTGMAHVKFRYTDHPHAKILRIDTAKAQALPGVVAVVVQDDLPDVRFGGFVQDRHLFAKDVVRFEGEIIAGVAALTEAIATQAAALIEVDYEPLPAVTDYVAAMDAGATLVHPDWDGYEKDENIVASGNTMAYRTIVKGDADAAMAGAEVVVKGRYVSDASQGVPIEPRAVIAQWQGDQVTIWSSTQVPYAARAGVAATLQVPEADVRIVVPLLGGGFGAKCDLHFEGQVAAIARAAEAPGQARVLPRGGVPGDRPAPRGHRDGVRDRGARATGSSSPARRRWCSTRARTAARAGSSGRWRRCTPAART